MKAARPRPRSGPANDADAMRAVARGELSALGDLYDAHHHALRQFLRRHTGDRDLAEDLTHETFLTAARVAASFDGRDSARPFLFGIALRLARRRRTLPERWRAALAGLADVLGHGVRTPEGEVSDAEQFELFEAALMRLSEEKRAVLLLVEREGLACEDAARALGIPVGTVWTRLHHARAELRHVLRKKGALDGE